VVGAALGLLAGRPATLAAQGRVPSVAVPKPLMVVARNNLSFGHVLPGIVTAVSALDAHAGLFEVQGPDAEAVRIEFVLPAALTTPAGDVLPLWFTAGDGFVGPSLATPSVGMPFDPRGAFIGSLSADGKMFVHLGGTALPRRPQVTGTYTATIVMTVFDVGS
jgi:hypothetical protein